jgi:hypothetical protein
MEVRMGFNEDSTATLEKDIERGAIATCGLLRTAEWRGCG